ncbi:unnamed protein product [Sphagnum troendelagicum]
MIRKQKHAQTATPLAAADDDDRCCCHYYDLHCDGTKFTKQQHAFGKQVSTIGKPRQTSVQPPHNPPPPHIDRRLQNFPQRLPKKIVMRKGKEHRGTAIVIVLEQQREKQKQSKQACPIQEGQEETKPRADTKKTTKNKTSDTTSRASRALLRPPTAPTQKRGLLAEEPLLLPCCCCCE